MKLFDKKLGAYYLLEMTQNNTGDITITLYKKWDKHSGYEATDNILHFSRLEREKALVVYNTINLKTLRTRFNWK